MKITEEINIQKILFNKDHNLGRLCANTQKNKSIDLIVKEKLLQIIPALADNCYINSIHDNCLTIETTRSEYLTALRFHSQELLYQLRQHPELYKLITIKFKINPDIGSYNLSSKNTNQVIKQNKPNKPNKIAKIELEKISQNIKNIALKEALLKLLKL